MKRVLFVDIETTPMEGKAWGPSKYEQTLIKVTKHSELLSVAWQWQGEKTVHCATRQGEATDKNLMLQIRELFHEADLVIGHNVKKFDRRKCNTRFLKYRINPPSPYKMVDTLEICKTHFALPSNKLDDVCEFLGIGKKLKHTGLDMWDGCQANEPASWSLMKRYNKHDVVLLKPLYEWLRPWHNTHPSVAEPDRLECTKCPGGRLKSDGLRHDGISAYRRYRCLDCGGWSRERLPTRGIKKKRVVNDN